MKILLSLLVLFFCLSALAQTRYQAEAYVTQKGTTVISTLDGDGAQDLSGMGTSDTATYSISVPTAGIYSLAFRGKGVYSFYVKKGSVKQTNTVSFSDSSIYSLALTDIELPAGTQTITLYFNAGFSARLNWFEINTTGLLLRNTFETTDDFTDWTQETCRSGQILISDTFARKGTKSARFEIKKSDTIIAPGCVRAEMRRGSEADRDRWYAFSHYLPTGFVSCVMNDIVGQWHEIPDWDLGEGWRSPPISLQILNDRYYLKIIYSPLAVCNSTNWVSVPLIDLGPVVRGEWIDWTFHIYFSHLSDGIVTVWRNGVQVHDRRDPNTFNDVYLPYVKIGEYKNGWNGWQAFSPFSERVIYYDEVRIGGGSSSYQEVSPK